MLKKKNIIKKKLSRRFFLKDLVFFFLTFCIFCNLNNNLIIKKKKCCIKTIKKNYYFANKTYRTETVKRVFKSYLDKDVNAEIIAGIAMKYENRKENDKAAEFYKLLIDNSQDSH